MKELITFEARLNKGMRGLSLPHEIEYNHQTGSSTLMAIAEAIAARNGMEVNGYLFMDIDVFSRNPLKGRCWETELVRKLPTGRKMVSRVAISVTNRKPIEARS